ncbi:hypothetical protein V8G54_002646 [Vigna mungo]|uniref:Uncharacterized protein n=1 Tax=Vigna mungo TaxID=3915 RepID=A0AAQ3PAR4_VIGMU
MVMLKTRRISCIRSSELGQGGGTLHTISSILVNTTPSLPFQSSLLDIERGFGAIRQGRRKPLEQPDIEKEVRKEVDEVIAKAKESQMPEPSDLFKNVYVKGLGVEAWGADRKELKATLP